MAGRWSRPCAQGIRDTLEVDERARYQCVDESRGGTAACRRRASEEIRHQYERANRASGCRHAGTLGHGADCAGRDYHPVHENRCGREGGCISRYLTTSTRFVDFDEANRAMEPVRSALSRRCRSDASVSCTTVGLRPRQRSHPHEQHR